MKFQTKISIHWVLTEIQGKIHFAIFWILNWIFLNFFNTGFFLFREETGSEIISCYFFGDELLENPVCYEMFFGNTTIDMMLVAITMIKKLKKSQNVLDNYT